MSYVKWVSLFMMLVIIGCSSEDDAGVVSVYEMDLELAENQLILDSLLKSSQSIIDDQNTLDFAIYPNPCISILAISSLGTHDGSAAVLVYQQGDAIEVELEGNSMLNVSGFNDGYFYVEIHYGNETYREQILKISR